MRETDRETSTDGTQSKDKDTRTRGFISSGFLEGKGHKMMMMTIVAMRLKRAEALKQNK